MQKPSFQKYIPNMLLQQISFQELHCRATRFSRLDFWRIKSTNSLNVVLCKNTVWTSVWNFFGCSFLVIIGYKLQAISCWWELVLKDLRNEAPSSRGPILQPDDVHDPGLCWQVLPTVFITLGLFDPTDHLTRLYRPKNQHVSFRKIDKVHKQNKDLLLVQISRNTYVTVKHISSQFFNFKLIIFQALSGFYRK